MSRFVYIDNKPIDPNGIQIPAVDLANVSVTSEDQDRMFHHDGTGDIALVDGTVTSEQGHYTYDKDGAAGNWRPILDEATHLGGVTKQDLVRKTGDNMEGNLSIEPDSSDAQLELLADGFDNPLLSMGYATGEGGQIQFEDGEIQFGELSDGDFYLAYAIDVVTGETRTA